MSEFFQNYWPHILFLFAVLERCLAIFAALHALLKKRDTHSVIGWVGLIWLTPMLGATAYFLLGINRIQRKGTALQERLNLALSKIKIPVPDDIAAQIAEAKRLHPKFAQLVNVVGNLTNRPLLPGNKITPLLDGDVAYPEMLAAISSAKRSVTLQSYIFDDDYAGEQFIAALHSAHTRGVEVRVLIDDVGAKYSRPTSVRKMQRLGINCKTFLPTLLPRLALYANLRNHRKIMVVDGLTGFTGGMNIREGCLLKRKSKHPVQDLHFKFEGPVVTHLQEAFVTDWAFVTNEILQGDSWLPIPAYQGPDLARGITDGPDEDFERLLMAILGAIAVANYRVVIATPYFLPDASMIRALNVAALRGVEVIILLPEKNNNLIVQWASNCILSQVMENGCKIFLTKPPFDHTKLILVDEAWALVGSANLDPRSLRLNFEFNVECYSLELLKQLSKIVDRKRMSATELTEAMLQSRNFALRVRDGIARLLTPYL